MLADLETRLVAALPEFEGRVHDAAAFQELTRRGALPTAGLAVYLLPLGITGQAAQTATGLFRQSIQRAYAVLLCLQSTDRTGARALAELEPLQERVIAAVAGWGPDEAPGVMILRRAQLIPGNGMLALQIEFTLSDQLRISP